KTVTRTDTSQFSEEKTEHSNSVEPEQRNGSSTEKSVEKILTTEEAIFAFYDSERRYVENLKNGYHHFQHRLAIIAKRSKPILTEKEIIGIFGGFQTIGDANQSFLDDLIKLGIKGGIPAIRDGIEGEMKKFGHFLKLYSDYIDNVKQGVANLEVAKKKNKKFMDFLEVSEELCGRSLQSYLEEPIKRLPTYLQLLADLYTAIINEDQNSGDSLLEAVDFMKKMIDQVATKSKEKKARMVCVDYMRILND
ncbi:rhoGEF domain-containing protein, partial [Reticulomyxa filosa]